MTLMAKLNQDMKEAMKQKDKDTLSVIRMIKASVQKEEIAVGRALNDDEALTILSRELKQRKESIREFENANRMDLVEKTQAEVVVVERYLPKQLSKEDIKTIILEVVQQVGATKSDFGKVMGPVMTKLKGRADGTVVNELVKSVLSQLS